MAHAAAVGHWFAGHDQHAYGFLHDGRAANVLEAVLWHGGEAEATKQRVLKLSAADRAALVAFVQSL